MHGNKRGGGYLFHGGGGGVVEDCGGGNMSKKDRSERNMGEKGVECLNETCVSGLRDMEAHKIAGVV